jgi:hypothetical protein
MKTEAEIRQLMDAIELLNAQPCECRGSGHEDRCVEGGHMMVVAAENLRWVLGEATAKREAFQRGLIERAAELRRENPERN